MNDSKALVERTECQIKKLEKEEGLHLPEDYSVGNAVRSAMLILQDDSKKPLENCSKESIANSFLNMAVQGLSPSKKQCYFIPYGNTLQLQRSYFGTVAVAKRFSGIKDIFAFEIREGDKFDYKINLDTGLREIILHEQHFKNLDNPLAGAYAIIIREDGSKYVEIMTIKDIKSAWGMRKASGLSKAHTNFEGEMAKKTVINRACKMFVNTSNDSEILVRHFNKTTENEYENQDNNLDPEKEIQQNNASIEVKIEDENPVQEPIKEEPKEENSNSSEQVEMKF